MSLKSFAEKMGDLTNNGLFVVATIASGVIGGGILGYDMAVEDWDNEQTDQTEQVMADMSKQIRGLELADSKLTVLNLEAENTAEEMGGTWKESAQWEEYTLAKVRAEEKVSTQASSFFSTVMNSPDITEAGLGQLISDFNEISLGQKTVEFPKSGSTYAFKECQADIGQTGSSQVIPSQSASDIGTCVTEKTVDDGAGIFMAVPGVILSIFSLIALEKGASGLGRTARRRERKKQQRKMSQN